MGCSLGCFYFESFSTFLEWVVRRVTGFDFILHYLDDFLFMGNEDLDDCKFLWNAFFYVCSYFNIPLADEKTVGPVLCLDFLGVTIDSLNMEFQLLLDKIAKISDLLLRFIRHKKVMLKEMQSLLGMLAFATRVHPIG